MYTYLNLNKRKIKMNVISKLKLLGYKVDDNATIRDIQEIIKALQRDNGLMIDGYIGIRTMPLLGYSSDEIRKMLKLPKPRGYSPYYRPFIFCRPFFW